MKLTVFDIYKFSLQLTQPIKIKKHSLTHRDGILIHLKSDQGVEGIGEVSPLPGFSQETLNQCLDQSKILKINLQDQSIPGNIHRSENGFAKWLGSYELYPAVQCGIEMAVLNLKAASEKRTLSHFLTDEANDYVRLNGLIHGSNEEKIRQAKELITKGFRSIKIKVGTDIDEDINTVREISKIAGEHALLHCDANQSWDLKEAIHFGNEVGLASIAYIEEPFLDVTKIPEFFDKTMIPVALDESLIKLPLEDLKSLEGLDFLVLKPTLLGGFEKVRNLIARARQVGLESIISSSYESDAGLFSLANLSGSAIHNHYAGLDTGKYFKENLFKEPIVIDRGKIQVGQRRISLADLNSNLIHKIEL